MRDSRGGRSIRFAAVPSRFSRRSVLLAGAGLTVAAACGGDKNSGVTVDPDDIKPSEPGDASLVVASYLHAAAPNQRVALAMVRADGPERLSEALPVTLSGPGGARTVTPTLHTDGIDLPYLLFRHDFPTAGVYTASARYKGRPVQAAIQVQAPEQIKVPQAGQPFPSVPTPTTADGRGVNPICTRQPACGLHELSLDAALAEKRPLVVQFSTPALCQSQLCGPVLENMLAVKDSVGDKARFLHIEIYTDLTGKTLSPAVQAFKLEVEPFMFLVGADGVVQDRLDNAFDRVEARDAISRLVG